MAKAKKKARKKAAKRTAAAAPSEDEQIEDEQLEDEQLDNKKPIWEMPDVMVAYQGVKPIELVELVESLPLQAANTGDPDRALEHLRRAMKSIPEHLQLGL